jgi:hypothetical protein
VAITKPLQRIKNFEGIIFCDNVTVCDCEAYRFTLNEIQIEKIKRLTKSTSDNWRNVYEIRLKIVRQYQLNFKQLQNSWTKENLVLSFFSRTFTALNEFGNYFKLLGVVRDFLIKLNDFIKLDSSTCPQVNSTFKATGDQIDDGLNNINQKISNISEIAKQKVNRSLPNALTIQKPPLEALSKTLTDSTSFNDSTQVKWPRIPDTSGASYSTMKVRSCQEKKSSYGYALNQAIQNQGKLKKNLADLKAASGVTLSRNLTKRNAEDPENIKFSYQTNAEDPDNNLNLLRLDSESKPNSLSRKARAVSTEISEVINITTDLINLYEIYKNELNTAIFKVEST